MLQELFDAISRQAVEAHGKIIVKHEAEPAHTYWMRGKDGEWSSYDADPEPRDHTVKDLSSLKTFVDDHIAGNDETALRVWYSIEAVILIVDDDTRRDRLTLPLKLSPQMTSLQAMEKQPKAIKQTELVRWLRTMMAGAMSRCPNLLEIVRRVKFVVNQSGQSIATHGKTSVGRSIETEMTGVATIPELVEFTIPVFDASFPGINAVVPVAIDIDAGTESFTLIPIPGEIAKRLDDAEQALGEDVEEVISGVPAFRGTP